MSERIRYNSEEWERVGEADIGHVLVFRAGRHIGIHRVTTTGPLHIESLVYTLDDFAVDSNGGVISEMRASNASPKHVTGGLAMGMSNVYTHPTVYTAKNTTDIIHWVLTVPIRLQRTVNDNAGPFKYLSIHIPKQDKGKFQQISKKTEKDISKETMDYIKSLHEYEQNMVCGTRLYRMFFGCKLLK